MYCKELVEKLVSKYNRVYVPGKEIKRSVSLKFTKKEVPKYFDTSLDDYEKYNSSCIKLEDKDIIKIHWKDGLKNHIIEKITLNLDNLESAYEFINERPADKSRVEVLEIIAEYTGFNEIVDKFIEYLVQKIILNKSVKQYIDISDIKDIRRLFTGCIGVLNNSEECYIRMLSVKLYKDSKVLEMYERRICKVIKDFNTDVNILNDYEGSILELYNVYRNPRQVKIKGKIEFMKDDKVIDLGLFKDGLGISTKDLGTIEFIRKENIKRIITIENLTTYHTFNCSEAIIIYTGGFNSRSTIELLKKLSNIYGSIEYLHWGDIDCGGFKIYKHQKESTGIDFKPMYMDIDTYNKYKESGRPLTSNDIECLKRLLKDDSIVELEEVIRQMLMDMKKIEQESIDVLG